MSQQGVNQSKHKPEVERFDLCKARLSFTPRQCRIWWKVKLLMKVNMRLVRMGFCAFFYRGVPGLEIQLRRHRLPVLHAENYMTEPHNTENKSIKTKRGMESAIFVHFGEGGGWVDHHFSAIIHLWGLFLHNAVNSMPALFICMTALQVFMLFKQHCRF